jgi:biotin carboxyl carrier protein
MGKELRTFIVDDAKYVTTYTKKFLNRKKYVADDPKQMLAFIPGVITKLKIKAGDKVKRGQSIFTLEAMKMQNDVCSPMDGVIKAVHMQQGTMVAKNQLLVEFE